MHLRNAVDWGCGTGDAFEETPYTSAAICGMLARRLKNAGMDASLKAHGLRRGKMQHRVHQNGEDLEAVMQTSQIGTVAVGMRYVDQNAHVRR